MNEEVNLDKEVYEALWYKHEELYPDSESQFIQISDKEHFIWELVRGNKIESLQ